MQTPLLRKTQFLFAGQFVALFAAGGIVLPFWPYWLGSQGFSANEVALVLAVCTAARVVLAPGISAIADASGNRKRVLFLVALAFLCGLVPFFNLSGFWSILLLWTVVGTLFTTMIPMSDSLSVVATKQLGLDYGRARLWGSLSFIVVSTAAGWFLSGRSADAVLWMLMLAAAVICCAVLLLPNLKTPTTTGKAAMAFAEALRQPGFLGFLGVTSMLLASHAVLYGFGTLHWTAAGHSETVVGMLWAEGVILEVLVFAFGGWLLRHLNITGLFLFAVVAGVIRWTVLGVTTDLVWLFLVQALHAGTFAAAHLASVTFIGRSMPDHLGSTAQGLFDACAMGIVFAVAMWGGGTLYDAFGGHAFWAMAAMSGIGGVLLLSQWGQLGRYQTATRFSRN
mgnify:CR=1 FL=1